MAVKRSCGVIISSGGFLFSLVGSEAYLTTALMDHGPKSAVSRAGNPFEATSARALVPEVLSLATSPKIGAAIVQAVSVNMVNDLPSTGLQNKPMHFDEFPAYLRLGINRPRVVAAEVPRISAEPTEISLVHFREVSRPDAQTAHAASSAWAPGVHGSISSSVSICPSVRPAML